MAHLYAVTSLRRHYIAAIIAACFPVYVRKATSNHDPCSHFTRFAFQLPSTVLYVDNTAAKTIAEHQFKLTELVRHIALRHLYVQELVRKRIVTLVWVPSAENPADLGTKALDSIKFYAIISVIYSYL